MLRDIEEDEYDFDYLQVIDRHRLAKTIPREIAGLLIAEAENEADEA